VLKERPIVYLYHRKWLWAYNPKLQGVRNIPDGLLRVTGLKMAPLAFPPSPLAPGPSGLAHMIPMFDFLVKRIATLVPTLVLVSMLIFGLQQLLPGDPAKILAGEEQDPRSSPTCARSCTSTSRCRCATPTGSAACCAATSANRCATSSRC
jgi:hypothetical protein